MNRKNDHPEDRISLEPLLRNFFRMLAFIKAIMYKRIGFLIAGLLLGIALGTGYYIIKPKLYKVSMVVTFNKLTKKTYAEIIKQLNVLATSGSTAKLAEELRISEKSANNIVFIAAKTMNNDELETDTSSKINQPFKIKAGLLDNTYADTLENALLFYLNNLPYLKKLAEAERKNNTERLAYIKSDMEKLDSLKTEFNRFLASSKISATIYNNAINPAEIYVQSENLIKNKEHAQKALYAESDAVSLVDGFKATASYQSRSLPNLVFILGIAGLLAGFLFGLFIETKNIYR